MLRTILAGLVCLIASAAAAAEPPPLVLETKIPFGDVSVRIDHLAVDPVRQRLFVAERGNNSLAVIDLDAAKLLRRIAGLRRPQGVSYDRGTDTVFVANAGDGSVRLFEGGGLGSIGTIGLGSNADAVRSDGAGLVFVGHNRGLAIIDAARRQKQADIALAGQPGSFALIAGRIFVNLPEAHVIAVLDAASRQRIASWHVPDSRGNFPMAVIDEGKRLAIVFRDPAAFVVLDAQDGQVLARLSTCGDAGDVFWDGKRRRAYVSCGAGSIDVFSTEATPAPVGRIPTAYGARTALFVPERDRLYLAVRASGNEPEAIWVFRPAP